MNRLRKLILLFPLMLMLFSMGSPAYAAPYEGYNYSWLGNPEPAPVSYLPARQIDGNQLGIGAFNRPEDVYITNDNQIYVVDSGNNRIVRLDSEWNVTLIIDSFTNEGRTDSLSSPMGVFVTDEGSVYVADTGNKRVLQLSDKGELIREFGTPQSDILADNFIYEPIKLVVDSAGRLYVISKGNFNGIMAFDSGGKFTGFMGVNPVLYSAIDLFWKQVMTEEQRSKQILFIPVEFNNIDIDSEGFIYATTGDPKSSTPVQRLNPSGADVMKRNGYHTPLGDIWFSDSSTRSGRSSIISVTADQNGLYSILDNTRGRIFTYDRDGNLLYVYGQLGEQVGTFKTPTDIDMLGEKMIVTDKGLNHLVVFEPTRYGSIIRNAVINNDIGEEEKAVAGWREALQLNNNLEIAYVGMGKAELRQGNNYEAMQNFELGTHREYYSRAFERYRKEFMWEHFGKIAGAIVIALIAILIWMKKFRRKNEEPGTIGMAWFTMFHPFKGFWELKYENRGRVWLGLLFIVVLAILYSLKKEFSGFIFNYSLSVSIVDELKFLVLPFFLWCVANWSTTTLMEGEGKFKEIIIATAYAMMPLIIVQIPLIILSNILTMKEGVFYYLIESVAFLWFLGLLFVGMLTVHQYSIGKTIATMFLSLIVIGIIVFLGLLFFSLAQQMLSFGTTIYKELMFRFGEG